MRLWAALALALLGQTATAQVITDARFVAPTDRYAHGILGDAIEWGGLQFDLSDGTTLQVTLPEDHVFEDVAPRLLDVTGDGEPEIVVVEADVSRGAALAIYAASGKLAETPHIGRSNRWLAPIGAADLDGDGLIELAYIDRPHLAKTLRIWRFDDGALRPVADLPGFTNHRIGEVDIAGDIRTCAGLPEMIVATADWSRLIAVSFQGGDFALTDIGPHRGRPSFRAALACQN